MTLPSKGRAFLCVVLMALCLGGLTANESVWAQTNIVPLSPKEAKKAREADEKAAKSLFESAQDKTDQRNYWQAAVDLILVLDFYPGYSRLEDVVFLLADCLYKLEMYDGADRMYRYLLRSVTKTRLVAESILGLQKVAYERGDYPQSLKFYKALESHYTEHKGIYESRYYALQTYYNTEIYNLVHNLVPHIRKKSEFYPFAIYTSGLAHLKKKMCARLWPT